MNVDAPHPSPLLAALSSLGEPSPARLATVGELQLAADYGDVAAEYAALYDAVGLVDRSDQAWLAVTGKDRQTWLNNLCTNEVRKLQPGDGCDAFCTTVKGRILFELAIYAGREGLQLSLDRRSVPVALPHFDKYIIADDVQVTDCTAEVGRLGLMGPRAADLLARFGLGNAHAMANHQHAVAQIGGVAATVCKSHFAGAAGFDVIVPAASLGQVVDVVRSAGGPLGLRLAGREAVNVARVEAGRGALGAEIGEEFIPNETAQERRAVHFTKGCYLGQEIIIRIKHQGTPARYLCGVAIEPRPESPEALPPLGSEVRAADKPDGPPAGKLTSVVRSPRRGMLGLAYMKRGVYDARPALELRDAATGQTWCGQAVALPFVPQPE